MSDVAVVLVAAAAGWLLGRRSVRRGASGVALLRTHAGPPPYDYEKESVT